MMNNKKYLILLPILLFLLCRCSEDDNIYHIRDVNNNRFTTREFTRVPNGIKFYDLGWEDTVELYGSFYIKIPQKNLKVQKVKTINHNDYSK